MSILYMWWLVVYLVVYMGVLMSIFYMFSMFSSLLAVW